MRGQAEGPMRRRGRKKVKVNVRNSLPCCFAILIPFHQYIRYNFQNSNARTWHAMVSPSAPYTLSITRPTCCTEDINADNSDASRS